MDGKSDDTAIFVSLHTERPEGRKLHEVRGKWYSRRRLEAADWEHGSDGSLSNLKRIHWDVQSARPTFVQYFGLWIPDVGFVAVRIDYPPVARKGNSLEFMPGAIKVI